MAQPQGVKLDGLSVADLDLLMDALAKAASRHESQARFVKWGSEHDKTAQAMRALRSRLWKAKLELDLTRLSGAVS